MQTQEIMCTTIGEMLDMVSCDSIYNGNAKPKKRPLSLEQILMLE